MPEETTQTKIHDMAFRILKDLYNHDAVLKGEFPIDDFESSVVLSRSEATTSCLDELVNEGFVAKRIFAPDAGYPTNTPKTTHKLYGISLTIEGWAHIEKILGARGMLKGKKPIIVGDDTFRCPDCDNELNEMKACGMDFEHRVTCNYGTCEPVYDYCFLDHREQTGMSRKDFHELYPRD